MLSVRKKKLQNHKSKQKVVNQESTFFFFKDNLMGDEGEDRGQKHKSQLRGLLKQFRGETN